MSAPWALGSEFSFANRSYRMFLHREIWSYVFITLITVLIWAWAAGETREEDTLSIRLRFTSPQGWLVAPLERTVSARIEGSRFALQRAKRTLAEPIVLTVGAGQLAAGEGRQTLPLADVLNDTDRLARTGIRVKTTDPITIDVDIDRVERIADVPIVPVLRGVQTASEPIIEPASASIMVPTKLIPRNRGELRLEAEIERWRLDELEPGREYVMPVKPRVPVQFGSPDSVRVEPETVMVKFTLLSRTRRTTLDTVRVQLAGPVEDQDDFSVEISEADRVLRNVTVSGEDELIREIEAGTTRVVAIVHLTTRDKELGVQQRPVSYFVALRPDRDDQPSAVFVEAQVGETTAAPEIHLRITEKRKD